MSAADNPLLRALAARGITPPPTAVDLGPKLEEIGVERCYVIGTTGRCGSTWLAYALQRIPGCGKPMEYFSEEAIPHYGAPDGSGSLEQFLGSIVESARDGPVFGVKIDGLRLRWLAPILDVAGSFRPPRTAWIDMRRLNIVKQAFSFSRAKATGIWHVPAGSADAGHELDRARTAANIPDRTIWQHIVFILDSERELDRIYKLHSINPMRIFYEELLDSKAHLLLRILAHLFPDRTFSGAEAEAGDAVLKIADHDTDPWETAFLERNVKAVNLAYDLRRNLPERSNDLFGIFAEQLKV